MPKIPTDYEALRQFCSVSSQRALLDALIATDPALSLLERYAAAAETLGVSTSTVTSRISSLKAKAAYQGYSPEHDMVHPVPETHYVKRVSTLYDGKGRVKSQWVKSDTKSENLYRIATEIADAIKEELPRVTIPQPATKWREEIMVGVPMGDPHVGLHAWAEESGEDFDLKIAERDLCGAVDRLMLSTPEAAECLIGNLGDFFHADNSEGVTLRSRHALDVDTRWAKVLRVGVKIMRYVVEAAARKHKRVRVINAIGNHDDHSSVFLTACLGHIFENEPRVTVELLPRKVHYHRFGRVLIAVTHGDTIKMDRLPLETAASVPQEWGETEFRYGWTGHIHTDTKKEFNGMVVESFRTLAARDAWAASMGYKAGRDMKAIVYHRDFGELERHTVNVAMLRKTEI